jgi:hypothetical protein
VPQRAPRLQRRHISVSEHKRDEGAEIDEKGFML